MAAMKGVLFEPRAKMERAMLRHVMFPKNDYLLEQFLCTLDWFAVQIMNIATLAELRGDYEWCFTLSWFTFQQLKQYGSKHNKQSQWALLTHATRYYNMKKSI